MQSRLLAGALLLALASAIPSHSSTSSSSSSSSRNFLSLPISSKLTTIPRNQSLQRRQDVPAPSIPPPPPILLKDASFTHFVPITLGTPPQSLLVSLDTGAWQFWVNPNCTLAPTTQQALCEANGHYDPGGSSTAVVLADEEEVFEYSPGGGVSATVYFVSDGMSIGALDGMKEGEGEGESEGGQIQLESYRIGVARTSIGLGSGVLGLGPHPDPGVGFADRDNRSGFGGVLGALQRAGVITSRAYGMDLVGRGEGSGAVVFGGVDRSRFTGQLFRTEVIPPSDAPTNTARFWVRVKGISNRAPGGEEVPFETPYQDYLLDSGTTISFLPPVVVEGLTQAMNGISNPEAGAITVDCKFLDEDLGGATIFEFEGGEVGGGKIEVPYRNFIIDTRNVEGLEGEGIGCVLGVAELKGVVGQDVMPILGLAFMKSAYAVFDLDNISVHLAQAASCGEPDVLIIGNGPEAVPVVDGNC